MVRSRGRPYRSSASRSKHSGFKGFRSPGMQQTYKMYRGKGYSKTRAVHATRNAWAN